LYVLGNSYFDGNVGIGTNTYWGDCKLRVAYEGNDFTFFPNFAGINLGGYIAGESVTRLDFWHPLAGWNKIRIKGYTLSSDSSLKTDILPIEDATAILRQLKTYSYHFKSDSREDSRRDYGVLAQEVEAILPELVDTSKGSMFVNYNAFTGILIKGFNEQQILIEQLQKEIKILQDIVFSQEMDLTKLNELQKIVRELQEVVFNCCKISNTQKLISETEEQPQVIQEKAILYQNNPNPFFANTEISCYLPETTEQAFLYIYNLQGIELRAYSIKQTGLNTLTVQASELPAGMYLYTLVVDNEIIDTKRMILTK